MQKRGHKESVTMIDKDLVGCIQEEKFGYIHAKLDQHEEEIDKMQECGETKKRRIGELEVCGATITADFTNLEKRFEKEELRNELRHNELIQMFTLATKELGSKFDTVNSKLNKIMWVGIGGTTVIAFIFLVFEKAPSLIDAIQKFF